MAVAVLAIAVLLGLGGPASALEASEAECTMVRSYVAVWGAQAARDYAKRNKWPAEKVAAAEKCVQSSKVR